MGKLFHRCQGTYWRMQKMRLYNLSSQAGVVGDKRSLPLLLPVARLALSMRLHFLDQLAKLNRKKWLNQ